MNFLIVDDDKFILRWLSHMIAQIESKCTILTAEDGIMGINIFNEEKIDIIITDIKMPNMDGIEMITKIRKKSKDIPIIVISAYSDFEIVRGSLKNSVFDYLLKDEIDKEKLETVINEVKKDFDMIRKTLKNIGLDYLENEKNETQRQYVNEGLTFIQMNFNRDISLTDLAAYIGISPEYLSKLFTEILGLSFTKYLTNYRLDIAKKILSEKRDTKIQFVSEFVGYNNVSYFSSLFKKKFKMTPYEYKSNVSGE